MLNINPQTVSNAIIVVSIVILVASALQKHEIAFWKPLPNDLPNDQILADRVIRSTIIMLWINVLISRFLFFAQPQQQQTWCSFFCWNLIGIIIVFTIETEILEF